MLPGQHWWVSVSLPGWATWLPENEFYSWFFEPELSNLLFLLPLWIVIPRYLKEFHFMLPSYPSILAILAMVLAGQFQPYILVLTALTFPYEYLRKMEMTSLNLSAIMTEAPPRRIVSSAYWAWLVFFTPLAIFRPLSSLLFCRAYKFLLKYLATMRYKGGDNE